MEQPPGFIDQIEAILGEEEVEEIIITRPGFTKCSENFEIILLSSYQLPHWGQSGVFSFPEARWDWTEFINFLLFSCEIHQTSIQTAVNFAKECLSTWTNLVAERIEDVENKAAFIEVYNKTTIEVVEGSRVGAKKLVRVTLGDELVTSGVFEMTKLRRMNNLRSITAEVLAGIVHDKNVVKELDIPNELKVFVEAVEKNDWREVDVKYGWNPLNLSDAMKRTGQWDGVKAIQKYLAAKNKQNFGLIPLPNIQDCASSTVVTFNTTFDDSGNNTDWEGMEAECTACRLGVEVVDNVELFNQ